MLYNSDFIRNPLEQLSYYSKSVKIITRWEGGRFYIIDVYDENKQVVVDIIKIEVNEFNFTKGPLQQVSEVFEQVKTKYVLDYDKNLSVNKEGV